MQRMWGIGRPKGTWVQAIIPEAGEEYWRSLE